MNKKNKKLRQKLRRLARQKSERENNVVRQKNKLKGQFFRSKSTSRINRHMSFVRMMDHCNGGYYA